MMPVDRFVDFSPRAFLITASNLVLLVLNDFKRRRVY